MGPGSAVNAHVDAASAMLLPRIVRLAPNLHAVVFSLMKLIPARHILLAARRRGELPPGTVVVETTSGTFGLALALQSVLMGVRLVLVGDPVIGPGLRRRLVDLGARVEIVDRPAARGGIQAARLARLAEVRAELPATFCPEQYTNPDNPASYAVVAEQLTAALGVVDCVVGPVGSGGSLCGTVGALRAGSPHTVAVAVDTHHSTLFGHPDGPRPLRGIGNSVMPANLDHSAIDEVHWCTPAEAYTATRDAHRRYALFQGPTSGAALTVAHWWARRNPDAQCVVMLPDDGHRYLDTVYDDQWLAAQGLDLDAVATEPVDVAHPAEELSRWSRFRWGRRDLASLAAAGVAVP